MTDWHFPRTSFAEQVHGALSTGPERAATLFGPRRTGKTEFLLRDLGPLAQKKGSRVVYASFWQLINAPVATLLYEIDRSLRTGSILDRAASAAQQLSFKVKLAAPNGVGEVEINLGALKGPTPQNHFLLLDQYFERLHNPSKPTFLLLDEFQELARAPDAAAIFGAMRTSLDKRRDGIVAVFTGSSLEGLRRVFSARQAPFFRFAQSLSLPPLDAAFVDHQLRVFHAVSKAKISTDTAMATFERFESNPMFFQKWLAMLTLNPGMRPTDAADAVQAAIAEEFGFAALWAKCDVTKRLTARALADGVVKVFGAEGAEAMRGSANAPAPSPSAVQSALKWMRARSLAEKWDERWRLTDPLFEAWVRARPAEEFRYDGTHKDA